jgi:hypothetical protein
VSGDSVLIIVDGYAGTVTWHRVTPAGLVAARSVQFASPARRVTRGERSVLERRVREQMSAQQRIMQSWSDVPPRWSVADAGFVGDDGALWLGMLRLEGPPVRWTSIPGEGPPFAIELPAAEQVLAAQGERIYVGATNIDGAPVLKVYEFRTRR